METEIKTLLPQTKNIHVYEYSGEYFALDVQTVTALKIEKGFGRYLCGDDVTDLFLKESYENKLAALQRRNIFCPNIKDVFHTYESPLYKLSLEVFNGCNMRCLYCYAHINEKVKSKKMRASFKNIKKAIDYFVEEFGVDGKSYEVNIVGGGEPLLNFGLIKDIMEYCKEVEKRIDKKIVFWVFTNGTVFTDEIIEYFINERQGLTISLDGPADIHDKLRPFPDGNGSHGEIKKWIGKIQDKSKGLGGIENLWVSTVITAKHKSIKNVLMHLRELGVRKAQIRPIRTLHPDLSLSEKELESMRHQYNEMVDLLIEEAIAMEWGLLDIILNDRDFWGRQLLRLLQRQKIAYRCGAAKSKLCVRANGNIYPCDIGSDVDDLKLGTLSEGVSAENRVQYYKQEISMKDKCKECWCRYFCGGGCYVASFERTGKIDCPDKIECELVKIIVESVIKFVSEVNMRNPAAIQRIRKYINVQNRVLKKVYGL